MSDVVLACPECGGARMVDHPGGILVVDHRNECEVRQAEDATADADGLRAMAAGRPGFWRASTDTERALLDHWRPLDGAHLDMTEVMWITRSIRRRRWDGLTLAMLRGPAVETPVEQPGDVEPDEDAA